MSEVGTSDRDFYDRSIFHVVAHDLDLQLIGGFGVYPNLGVKDAYVCVRAGTSQHVGVAATRSTNRMRMQVGPIRIEVVEPLQRVRMLARAARRGVVRPRMDADCARARRAAPRDASRHQAHLDAHRFIGVGRWEGVIEADGERSDVGHADFTGTRDRSWGIRPVGGAARLVGGMPRSSRPCTGSGSRCGSTTSSSS